MNHFFATCPRGLENILAKELKACGGRDVKKTDGGVAFTGNLAACYDANLNSTVATRILMRVGRGDYGSEDDLYRAAFRVNWPNWFAVKHDFMVKVTAVRCPLKSLEFITLRVKDAVVDKFRQVVDERPSVNTRRPAVRIHVFLTARQYQYYVDTSGQALFQRGHRQVSVEAPLRENLAAGILKLIQWEPEIPLLDPMCGSGTFLLEAAMMAQGVAPGLNRSFGFEKLKNYESDIWKKIKNKALKRVKPTAFQYLYGSDMSQEAIQATEKNLEAAGLRESVSLTQKDFSAIKAPHDKGFMVTNPPYGVRIGEDEALAELYPKMGEVLKREFAGWNTYFLTNDMRLPKLMRLSPSKRTPLFNGSLDCRLFEIKMVAGSNRKPKD